MGYFYNSRRICTVITTTEVNVDVNMDLRIKDNTSVQFLFTNSPYQLYRSYSNYARYVNKVDGH